MAKQQRILNIVLNKKKTHIEQEKKKQIGVIEIAAFFIYFCMLHRYSWIAVMISVEFTMYLLTIINVICIEITCIFFFLSYKPHLSFSMVIWLGCHLATYSYSLVKSYERMLLFSRFNQVLSKCMLNQMNLC